MKELTHLSLFSGIGGIDLAAEWAGFRTVLFVEIDDYCQKVLKKHWPDVPIIGDIRDATKEKIMAYTQGREPREQEARDRGQDIGRGSEEKPLARNTKSDRSQEVTGFSERENSNTGGVCGTDRRPRRSAAEFPITLITGGFPCQPVSAAGQRRGKEDDRWLWPEMFRIISEVRSTWVVAENVAGLLNMGIHNLLSDLEGCGYEAETLVIPACAINAPHRRDRVFVVGYSKRNGYQNGHTKARGEVRGSEPGGLCESKGTGDVSNAESSISKQPGGTWGRRERFADNGINPEGNGTQGGECKHHPANGRSWWAVEPELGRVAYGVPHRVDRLKCLGNAVVPQQIYPILKAIADIEGLT